MIEIRIVDADHKQDINIPNEPFSLFGRMIPSYTNEQWRYRIVRFREDEICEMCFPDENYDYDKLSENSIFVGAYDGNKCIGLAILQHAMMNYMYLYDLKVNRDYRGQKIGKMLIEKSKEVAVNQGYKGIYTQGQDNNLGACLFYLENGFVIGGLDTHVYVGTSQEGKSDILFYLDVKMEQIALLEPQEKYADDIWAFRQEILECDAENENQFAGCGSLDGSKSAEEWIKICGLRKREETCGEVGTAVPSHTYLAVRRRDDKVVGVIDLRHHINHPVLGTWGGHCGYSVRPSERGKGYAKEMLRLNIQNAKAMGIERLLITCDVENEASEKTILANGGVYEKTIDVDGRKMKRYWITV